MYTFDAGVSVSGVTPARSDPDACPADPLSLLQPDWNRFPGSSLVGEAVALAQCVEESRMAPALPAVLLVPEQNSLVSRDGLPDWRRAGRAEAARVRRAGAV
jgi:hypothetical protein